MGRPHLRDFVDDRTKGRWQSLLRLYTSGDSREDCRHAQVGRQWGRAWHQSTTTLALRQESAGVDPSGSASTGWKKPLGRAACCSLIGLVDTLHYHVAFVPLQIDPDGTKVKYASNVFGVCNIWRSRADLVFTAEYEGSV